MQMGKCYWVGNKRRRLENVSSPSFLQIEHPLNGVFISKVFNKVSYVGRVVALHTHAENRETFLFRILYEDGDEEDLLEDEVQSLHAKYMARVHRTNEPCDAKVKEWREFHMKSRDPMMLLVYAAENLKSPLGPSLPKLLFPNSLDIDGSCDALESIVGKLELRFEALKGAIKMKVDECFDQDAYIQIACKASKTRKEEQSMRIKNLEKKLEEATKQNKALRRELVESNTRALQAKTIFKDATKKLERVQEVLNGMEEYYESDDS